MAGGGGGNFGMSFNGSGTGGKSGAPWMDTSKMGNANMGKSTNLKIGNATSNPGGQSGGMGGNLSQSGSRGAAIQRRISNNKTGQSG